MLTELRPALICGKNTFEFTTAGVLNVAEMATFRIPGVFQEGGGGGEGAKIRNIAGGAIIGGYFHFLRYASVLYAGNISGKENFKKMRRLPHDFRVIFFFLPTNPDN